MSLDRVSIELTFSIKFTSFDGLNYIIFSNTIHRSNMRVHYCTLKRAIHILLCRNTFHILL